MTNEQLKAFICVVEQGSFRSAATALHKTQPSVSAAVKSLEQHFNLCFFDRSHYRPQLTDEGRAFYAQAKKLLQQATQLEMYGHQLASAVTPPLAISLSAMCALPAVLEKIKHFWNQHPQMHLQVNTEHLSGVLEQLKLEKADLAIGPLLGIDHNFEYIEISQIKMITVIAPHLLDISPGIQISQQQLRNLPHILISDTGSVAPFDHVNVLLGGQRWYVNDYQMKKALLISAMGWARIPEHIVQHQLEDGSLLKIDVENFNSQSTVPMYLIKLKNSPSSSLAKAFWQDMLNYK
ncbi:MAG: LysR family transcriptional regulator [Oceanospirillaceae bacterium]|nr:LysR family transcriptional regulator [Oceanospirillaceae bacterium]